MIDWKVGDLAMCIENTDSLGRNIGLQKLNVYTVSNVLCCEDWCGLCEKRHPVVALELVGVRPRGGYIAWEHKFFTKVDPVRIDEEESVKADRPITKKREREEA